MLFFLPVEQHCSAMPWNPLPTDRFFFSTPPPHPHPHPTPSPAPVFKQIRLSSVSAWSDFSETFFLFSKGTRFVTLWPVKANLFSVSFCTFIEWTQEILVFGFSVSFLCDEPLICMWVFFIVLIFVDAYNVWILMHKLTLPPPPPPQ